MGKPSRRSRPDRPLGAEAAAKAIGDILHGLNQFQSSLANEKLAAAGKVVQEASEEIRLKSRRVTVATVVPNGTNLQCTQCKVESWCPHIKDFIGEGLDAQYILPPTNVVVPLFPESGSIYGTVQIDEPMFADGPALQTLVHPPDFGQVIYVPLGFWNPGEGRRSIRNVIMEWLRSRPIGTNDNKIVCPSTSHGFHEERRLNQMSENMRWLNAWCITMEGACFACVAGTDPSTADVPEVDTRPPWRT